MRLLALLLVLAGLACPPPRPAAGGSGPTVTDATTYRVIVERIAHGTGYYDAVGMSLRDGDYATIGVFNWRTPPLWSTLAVTPRWVARGALWALLAALVIATARTVPWPVVVPAVALQIGVALVESMPDSVVYFGEVWCGILIGLSVCAFTAERRRLGVALALAALAVRELAAIYGLVVFGIAAWQKRREAVALALGGLLYLALYSWHVGSVLAVRLPGDLAHTESWVQFGGLPFLQATLTRMGWVLVLPTAASAVALALVGVGCMTRAPVHLRAAAGAYGLAFLVIGQPFNEYWGAAAAPIWAITAAYGASRLTAGVD